jgi:predicted ATPase/regulation of enolase protein 1 (concanavalin A-like superfamily)
VARRLWDWFNGAVWFVSLADLTDPQLIADRVLETLRVPRSPTLAPLEQVIAALSEQPSLLLLDNYEHLVADGAALVQTLLKRVEGLTVLVTSRQRLNLTREREFRVPPLPTPVESGKWSVESPTKAELSRPSTLNAPLSTLLRYSSVQLFADRAQAVDADFQVTEGNAAAVAALCAQLGGLPLALELAAARAGVLTPAQMLAQLSRRLDFLVSRHRDVDPRQRSMRATCDWSYQLLPPEVQRFFARLSVFRGGCTLEAAEAVCEEGPPPPGLALECLTQLLENSLIVAEPPDNGRRTPDAGGDAHRGKEVLASQAPTADGAPLSELADGASRYDAPDEKRFRLPDTIREYGSEKLREAGEEADVRARHRRWFLELVERALPELSGPDATEWLRRLAREYDNLRAAVGGAAERDQTEELPLEPARLAQWGQIVERLAPAIRRTGQREAARAVLEDYVALCQTCGYHQGLARAYTLMGWFLYVNGSPGSEGTIRRMYELAISVCEAHGLHDWATYPRTYLAYMLAAGSGAGADLDRAEELARACLPQAEAWQDRLWIATLRADWAAFRVTFQASLASGGPSDIPLHLMLTHIEATCRQWGEEAAFRDLCHFMAEGYARAGLEPPLQHWYLAPTSPRHFPGEPWLREKFDDVDWHPSLQWRDASGRSRLDRATRPGWLGLHPPYGCDLWPAKDLNAPRLVTTVRGDFVAQTRVELEQNTQVLAGLLVWRDEHHFARLELQYQSERWERPAVHLEACVGGKFQIIGRGQHEHRPVWLRIERRGSEVRGLCSADGEQWLACGSVCLPPGETEEVGVAAINLGPGALAWFDTLLLWRGTGSEGGS